MTKIDNLNRLAQLAWNELKWFDADHKPLLELSKLIIEKDLLDTETQYYARDVIKQNETGEITTIFKKKRKQHA